MKKALLLHHDFYRMFKLLSYEEIGELTMAAFDYDINGNLPDFEDRLMISCFLRIKDSVDTNREKYAEVCQKRIESAKKGGKKKHTQKAEICICIHLHFLHPILKLKQILKQILYLNIKQEVFHTLS